MDETFDTTDSGASDTFPMQAGLIRKGGYIMIKNRPCKVQDVSTSKTGKHGHAKCHFVGIDIFTNKKMEELCPSSHNINVPNVIRKDYQVLDIEEDDNFVSLLDENGESKDDLQLPDDDELSFNIKTKFNEGLEDLFVTTISAIGEEKIMSIK